MELKDRISAHFGGDDFRTIDIPEWGTPAEIDEAGTIKTTATPLVVKYKRANLKELVEAWQIAEGNQALAKVRLITKKALDAEGKPLFKMADASFLMERADPGIIERLSQAIGAGDMPNDKAVEDAEGN